MMKDKEKEKKKDKIMKGYELEEGELDFHLWVMIREGLLEVVKGNKYRLTPFGKRLMKEKKMNEYVMSYKPKYDRMIKENNGFPKVDIPK